MSRNSVVAALNPTGWKPMGEIAKEAGLSKFQAKKFLSILEDEGDVERSTDADGRVIYRPTKIRR